MNARPQARGTDHQGVVSPECGPARATGSYSYVAVGASARTYDALAAPVRRRLLFAGEHTCKEHPDTVRAIQPCHHMCCASGPAVCGIKAALACFWLPVVPLRCSVAGWLRTVAVAVARAGSQIQIAL